MSRTSLAPASYRLAMPTLSEFFVAKFDRIEGSCERLLAARASYAKQNTIEHSSLSLVYIEHGNLGVSQHLNVMEKFGGK